MGGEEKDIMKVLDKGFIELMASMGDDETIVDAARLSYLKSSNGDDDKDKELIKLLIKNDHMSPFEQVEFQFLVKAPIFVARQWMRHRTWNYSEVSRRHSSGEICFYIPENIPEEDKEILRNAYFTALGEYDLLLKHGVRKEQARIILPVGLYTIFYAKTDLRNLFNFLYQRSAKDAQLEIREYAKAIEELISPIVPLSLSAWKEKYHLTDL